MTKLGQGQLADIKENKQKNDALTTNHINYRLESKINWQVPPAFKSDRSAKKPNDIGTPLQVKGTIFCIDDSPTIQTIVKGTLNKAGYKVIGNTEPLRCLMLLLKIKNPDLIIMDIKMPGIEGYELLRLIKRSSKLKNIPVIMLTSQTREFDRIRAKLLGAVGYITKPFSTRGLVKIVGKVLASKKRV